MVRRSFREARIKDLHHERRTREPRRRSWTPSCPVVDFVVCSSLSEMLWPSDWKTRYFYAQKSWSWIIWFAKAESVIQLPDLEFLNFRTDFITASMRRLNRPSLPQHQSLLGCGYTVYEIFATN